MISTARLVEPVNPGLSGIIHSSSRSVKAGSPNWLKEAKTLNRPNDAIATKPYNEIPTADLEKDDLEGQAATTANQPLKQKRRKRKAPSKKQKKKRSTAKRVIKKTRGLNRAQIRSTVQSVMKNMRKSSNKKSGKRKK